ncbi:MULTISPECIES: FecCD family ABC transporter permease [Pseudothermotoga]|jgi:iron complex transport system permease protein|uniref:Transport system permease protein n=1 Tax=Pseudothermotoga lettingae (strain ATCC BAA-301 / DSM 14385 / NBRC 107922 / TMO) TaxID=416591 RepID=A8F6M5_PSELT|nr:MULTISPECIES: iron ABC transporter permease [Pseudothermotoga]ABV33809.1 transport system permease protein [Pseudothermotoga lettingae TMO]KUK21375.1 MAG: Transport system permease protein [Pseudothermotoga lettingae]MDI3495413.1 heme transport system permease protein [Pseudothermotoga sp.]MDK2884365.1 heme transport system permease protein [Pseudothermotoga sp.]GLI49257.1 ferrichrome ABC transporter [Pseudothermotoga lettingae TMO]
MDRFRIRYIAFVILLSVLGISIFVSLIAGTIRISLGEIFSGRDSENWPIICYLRLPRIVIAAIVGANLAVSGVLLQSVMQNPLVDPGITGVSSGASIMAILIMLYLPDHYYLLPVASFLGGLVAAVTVYLLAWKKGLTPVRVVLAGVAVNAFLGAISSMLAILNSEKISGVLMWLNGNISGRSWKHVAILSVYSPPILILSILLAKACNLISLGDRNAVSLGTNINRARIIISLVAVFLASLSTSVVGIIGFIGLVVPHISRMIIGSNHKYLIPFSMFMGSSVLVLADTLSRTITKPYEIPVGITMSVFGGPFFLYLLRRRMHK